MHKAPKTLGNLQVQTPKREPKTQDRLPQESLNDYYGAKVEKGNFAIRCKALWFPNFPCLELKLPVWGEQSTSQGHLLNKLNQIAAHSQLPKETQQIIKQITQRCSVKPVCKSKVHSS